VTGSLYDARQTDAWACGVVLYALAVRQLPFNAHPPGATPIVQAPKDRRKMLVRIANAEYTWPGPPPFEDDATADAAHLSGTALGRSPGMRRIVDRLLVRTPAHRSAVASLWEDEWMWSEGAPVAPASASRSASLSRKGSRLSRKGTGRLSKRRETSPLRADTVPGLPSIHLLVGPSPLMHTIDGLPAVSSPSIDFLANSPGLDDAVDAETEEDGADLDIEVEEHGSLLDAGSIGEIARQELR
jgi:serine/threonine protein kinase